MGLSKDEILNYDDAKIEELEVPEWNGSVHIRVVNGEQLSVLQGLSMQAQEDPALNSKLLMTLVPMALCDETGKRLFTDGDKGALALKSGAALKRIFLAAAKMNKIDDDAIDELEKNLDGDQIADSGSA